MKPWIHGAAVDKRTREMRFLSVSSLQLADPESESGCLRKWWYCYVEGKKEPETDAQRRGTRLHAEVAAYLMGGEPPRSSQILSGMHLVPKPGPGLSVEHDMVPAMPDGKSGLAHAPLTAYGIKIVGAIDVINSRLENKGTTEVEQAYDEPGTIEVIDWKFPGSTNHCMSGAELVESIQMAGYATYIFTVDPTVARVRLSHGYMPVKGQARKSTILVDRARIAPTWEHASKVASSIRDAAKELDPNNVEPNRRACRAYGRDCIHATYCSAGSHNSLADVFGDAPVQLGRRTPTGDQEMTLVPTAPSGMTLFEQLQARTAGQASPPPAPPPPPAAVDPAELARLADEEARARDPQLHAACQAILSAGKGFPALGGEAAQAYARMYNRQLAPNAGYAGSGEYGGFTVSTLAEIARAAMDVMGATGAPPAAAPPSAAATAPAPPPATPALVSPETPPSRAGEPSPVSPVPETGRRRGRPRKGAAAGAAPASATDTAATPDASDEFVVYIDCAPDHDVESLWPLVWKLCDEIATKAGAPDIRAGKDDGPLGYGKWKGVLAAAIRANLPATGHYKINSSDDIGAVASATAREVCAARGASCIVGFR